MTGWAIRWCSSVGWLNGGHGLADGPGLATPVDEDHYKTYHKGRVGKHRQKAYPGRGMGTLKDPEG